MIKDLKLYFSSEFINSKCEETFSYNISSPQISWSPTLPPSLPELLPPPPRKSWHPWHENSIQVIGCLSSWVSSEGLKEDHGKTELTGREHEDDPLCCHPVNQGD